MLKSKILGAAIFVTAIFVGSCQHEVLPNVNADELCFERDVLPIIVSNCATSGCHDASTSAHGYNLTNYANITSRGLKPGNSSGSEFWEVIEENEMPPKHPLTSEQKAILKTWIDAGAENGINCSSKCDSAVFTYSGAVSPIVTKYCVGCHQYPGASGNLDLSSFQSIQNIAKSGALINSAKGTNGYSKMPPSGTSLSDCEIKQIQKWIDNGAQQN